MRKKLISLLTIVILITMIVMSNICLTYAAAGTIYESENNNTYSAADRTYDDYDNFGSISSSSDVDWWVVSFSTDGMANFYLGNIPSGCDYDISVYKANGSNLVCISETTRSFELIRCHVYAGVNYYVKIDSFSGYADSYYKFRTKIFSMKDARIFTTTLGNINTRPTAQNSYGYIWDMGFAGTEYTNNSVAAAYRVFPDSDIFVADSHGLEGYVTFQTTSATAHLYAKAYDGIESSNNKAIENFSSGQLDNVDLVIFGSCKGGVTSSIYGNLVDMTLSKGAYCCFGWKQNTMDLEGSAWFNKFFYYCSLGNNVNKAAELADAYINTTYSYYYSIVRDRYTGNSPLDRLVLGEA